MPHSVHNIIKKLSYRLETGHQQCISISFYCNLVFIALMTYTYVRHVRHLRPTNRLTYYAHSE